MVDSTLDNTSLTFPVDPEHAALRFSVIVIFVIGWILGFVLFNRLIPGNGLNLAAGLAGFALTAIITRFAERFLKTRWPSGRTVEIHGNRIQILARGAVQHEVDASRHVNVLQWRFKIKRRSRVPKGWFVVACALEQDNHYLSIYTFMPPDQANAPGTASRFKVLLPNKDTAQDLRLAGEQRRLRTAEEQRWMQGAEMSNSDFETFLTRLQGQFPKWMPSS